MLNLLPLRADTAAISPFLPFIHHIDWFAIGCYWWFSIGCTKLINDYLQSIENILFVFFYSFFSYYFFRWMAYNHLSTFILYILCFLESIICIYLQLFMIYLLHLFAIVYDLLFAFICNCLWLVIYNPVLLIAIWPPSPSLILWSPPRSGELEY